MDSENVYPGVSYSRRSEKRTFVYSGKEEAKATSGKKLKDRGRVLTKFLAKSCKKYGI